MSEIKASIAQKAQIISIITAHTVLPSESVMRGHSRDQVIIIVIIYRDIAIVVCQVAITIVVCKLILVIIRVLLWRGRK